MKEVKSTSIGAEIILGFEEDILNFGNQIGIRFYVNGKELLSTKFPNGKIEKSLSLLLPAFVTLGMAAINVCHKENRTFLELDDYGNELIFQKEGELIKIESNRIGECVKVDCLELVKLWKTFAITAKNEVITRNPEKINYKWWYLLEEYPNPDIIKMLTDFSRIQ